MLDTRQGRGALAALAMVAMTGAAIAAARARLPRYDPRAPAYRQKGPAQAPVTIAEFADFECLSCAAAGEPLRQMRAMFPDKIRLVFKYRPWSYHRWAKQAAVAAECAGRAGKFWEMHDRLYERQSAWAVSDDPKPFFAGYAREIGLDPAALLACSASPDAAAAVDADLAEASRRWVNSTPTFFINGERFVGAKQLRTSGLTRVEKLLSP